MAEILQVVDLVKRFPVAGTRLGLTALNKVSFTLDEGETLGLVGESGSGKTTLGRCILRLLEPTSGNVFFLGQDTVALSSAALRRLRAQIQIVYQNPWEAFNPKMTIGQIIEEPLKLHTKLSARERAREVLSLADMVGLGADSLKANPKSVSTGEQQRAAIARAVATKPKLIILDEPTSSLDLSVRLQIVELLTDLQRRFRISYIFISHDLTSVLRISNRIAIMYLGQILEMGPIDAIFQSPKQPYSRALLSSVLLPDPWADKQRLRLAGEIPSPINLPSGCPLASRCPMVEEPCRTVAPPRVTIGHNGWWAACHALTGKHLDDWERQLVAAES